MQYVIQSCLTESAAQVFNPNPTYLLSLMCLSVRKTITSAVCEKSKLRKIAEQLSSRPNLTVTVVIMKLQLRKERGHNEGGERLLHTCMGLSEAVIVLKSRLLQRMHVIVARGFQVILLVATATVNSIGARSNRHSFGPRSPFICPISHCGGNKGLFVLLSRTQAGPGRTVRQEQEEISRNHVQTFISPSVR